MLDNLLTGGLLLGAFFMATDYSTSVTAPGRIIYGVGCGALVLIRVVRRLRRAFPLPSSS